MPNYELGNIYEYDGSITSLYAGALLDTNLLNFGNGPGSATISDDDGTLDATDTGVTQIYFDSFLQDSITYLGAGDIYTIGVLGLRVDPRPVAAFEFNGQVYLYAPEGLPLLSAVSFGVDIDVNATIELPPNSLVPDGVVNGLNSSEVMGLGYTDQAGDQITENADIIEAEGGDDVVYAHGGEDLIHGGIGDDTLYGGNGGDTLDGGDGLDVLTGGEGADVFVASGDSDIITDFDAYSGVGDGNTDNNDFVDLSGFYNATTLAAWNAANPSNIFDTPLDWLRADIGDDGVLQQAGGFRINVGGQAVDGSGLNSENTAVICFVAGTCIETARGHRPVEKLQPGDLVKTIDNGLQPILWIGSRILTPEELNSDLRQVPVCLASGALGEGYPERELRVSPQHRILVKSKIAERIFGCDEVLVAAKFLLDLPKVTLAKPEEGVEYWHFLLSSHNIVIANGAYAESLFPGPQALQNLGPKNRAKVEALIHARRQGKQVTSYAPARIFSKQLQAKELIRRSMENRKALMCPTLGRWRPNGHKSAAIDLLRKPSMKDVYHV